MDKLRSDTPKKQHYVPQFLLKNFSHGKKNKIFTFDKSRVIKFETSVKDSASEKGFYNFNLNGEVHTLEHKLSKLEGECGVVIKKICKEESLENLTDDDRIVLCVFVANLLLRVKKQREFLDQINSGLAEWLQSLELDLNEVENFRFFDRQEIEKQHIEATQLGVLKIFKYFYNKPIVLYKSPNGSNFIISDNPVVMFNHWSRESRGNLGIE